MNAHYSPKVTIALLFLTLMAAGCGARGRQAYKRGAEAEAARNFQVAMELYKAALDQDPSSVEFRLRYERTRFAAALEHFDKGRRALEVSDMQLARAEFARTVEIDPTNTLAQAELAKVTQILANRTQNLPEPKHDIVDLKDSARTDSSPGSLLSPKYTGLFSVHYSQPTRTIFEAIGQLAGLNVIFDRDFADRTTRTLDLTDVDVYGALDTFAVLSNTFWQPVNQNTIIVVPESTVKRRDYEQQILKTIYLTNPATSQELNDILTAIRTLFSLSYIVAYPPQNAIVIRDTADRVALAEKVIEDIDKSKPEVVIDITVMEVDLQDLRNLGILPPQSSQITLAPPGSTAAATVNPTLQQLGRLNSTNFLVNVPSAAAQFLANSTRTKFLQNPSVRVTDGKQANFLVGSSVPIATSVQQATGLNALGPTVNVQYINVGVEVTLTPRVLLNREVSLTTNVTVSAISGTSLINTISYPVISKRAITHDIKLAEGETNILGGIVSDTESIAMSGIPLLKDIPILGRLFGQEKKQRDQAEVIIMMTPHIIRMPDISEENLRAVYTGTQSIIKLRTSPQVPTLGDNTQPATTTPAPAPAGAGPAAAPAPGTPATTPATTNTPPLPAGTTLGPARPAAAAPVPEPRPTTTTIAGGPTPVLLPAGTVTTVNLTINGADIWGADLVLSYDPSAFSIEEVRDAGFLSRDGQVVATVRNIETDKGIVRISLERPPQAAALSGTGALVTLLVKPGSKKGASVLKITDFRVRDNRQNVGIGKPAELQVTVQ